MAVFEDVGSMILFDALKRVPSGGQTVADV
jgi:hypothetical protein